MTVPSPSFRNFTRLYFIVWTRVPTTGPTRVLVFGGCKDEEFNSTGQNSEIAVEYVNRIVLPSDQPDQEIWKAEA